MIPATWPSVATLARWVTPGQIDRLLAQACCRGDLGNRAGTWAMLAHLRATHGSLSAARHAARLRHDPERASA